MKKYLIHKNFSILLASLLIVVSNLILSQASLLLYGEPDPPEEY